MAFVVIKDAIAAVCISFVILIMLQGLRKYFFYLLLNIGKNEKKEKRNSDAKESEGNDCGRNF